MSTPAPLPAQGHLNGIDMDDDFACGSPLQKQADAIDGMARQLLAASNNAPHVQAFIERAFADTLTGDGLAIILRREVSALGKKQTEAFKPQGFDLAVKGDLKRKIDYRLARDVPILPVHWIWTGVLARGAVSMLSGAGGLGKSWVLCDTLARLSVGAAMPDGTFSVPMPSVYYGREDDLSRTTVPRMKSCGGDSSKITVATLSFADTGEPADLVAEIPRLIADAKENGWALMVFDTFSSFATAGTDTNSAGDVRILLNALQRLATATDAAVWIVTHTKKPGNAPYQGAAVDAVAGSVQMAAGVRMVALLEGEETGPRRLHVVKSNLAPPRHPGGWTWTFTDSKDGGTTPAIAWKIADQEVVEAAAVKKIGRSVIAPAALRDAVLKAVEKGPLKVSEAEDKAWRCLLAKPTGAGLRKADVESAMIDLLRDLGDGLELRAGSKGARMIGLPGTFEATPEERCRALAKPGMSARELSTLAKCHRTLAGAILATLNPAGGSLLPSEVGSTTGGPAPEIVRATG